MEFTDPEDQSQITLDQLPLAALKRKLFRAIEDQYGLTDVTTTVPVTESRGTATVTITNGTQAISAAVPHGLSGVPVAVVGTAHVTADTRDDYIVLSNTRDGTNLTFNVRGSESVAFPLPNPTVVTFDWIAKL